MVGCCHHIAITIATIVTLTIVITKKRVSPSTDFRGRVESFCVGGPPPLQYFIELLSVSTHSAKREGRDRYRSALRTSLHREGIPENLSRNAQLEHRRETFGSSHYFRGARRQHGFPSNVPGCLSSRGTGCVGTGGSRIC